MIKFYELCSCVYVQMYTNICLHGWYLLVEVVTILK